MKKINNKFCYVTNIYEWIDGIVFAIMILVFIFSTFIRTSIVSGESMYPTLEDGDRLILQNILYEPTAGDIVVLTHQTNYNVPIVKRIIATQGQTIDINYLTGDVLVDNIKVVEPYINEVTRVDGSLSDGTLPTKLPSIVPKGKVFVMGDNRNHSEDSRFAEVGMIDDRYILGQAVFRMFPFDKLGTIK
ncbi:MAG: signal peptidase I [Oscillospiraceae bacterium]